MQKTRIEWVLNPDGTQGYTSNPIKGKCLNACHYCYAEAIRKRFKKPAEISWHPEELQAIKQLRMSSTIFVGSTIDIWAEWMYLNYQDWIVQSLDDLQGIHIFLLLTKNPFRYEDFPNIENLWLGITDDCQHSDTYPLDDFSETLCRQENKTFVSFEPLLGELGTNIPVVGVDWIIIGALTQNGKPLSPDKGGTKKEWVLPIVEQADKHNIPVFLKNNLLKLYPELPKRQEVPWLL